MTVERERETGSRENCEEARKLVLKVLVERYKKKVSARPARWIRMWTSTDTEIREVSQTWLRVQQRDGIPVDTLASSTKESLSCMAEPVLKLVMLAVAEFLHRRGQ